MNLLKKSSKAFEVDLEGKCRSQTNKHSSMRYYNEDLEKGLQEKVEPAQSERRHEK